VVHNTGDRLACHCPGFRGHVAARADVKLPLLGTANREGIASNFLAATKAMCSKPHTFLSASGKSEITEKALELTNHANGNISQLFLHPIDHSIFSRYSDITNRQKVK
jgi:hypothetical protein